MYVGCTYCTSDFSIAHGGRNDVTTLAIKFNSAMTVPFLEGHCT